MQQSKLLDTARAAIILGIAKRTLEKYRVNGMGPRFLKLGARVLYDPQDLALWISARRRRSTSDSGGEGAAA
ncbi:MAG: DNA-binding protein [Lentisphaerae bacterium]|nr:DNA-binding protein [Lentisphaerota bacterium]